MTEPEVIFLKKTFPKQFLFMIYILIFFLAIIGFLLIVSSTALIGFWKNLFQYYVLTIYGLFAVWSMIPYQVTLTNKRIIVTRLGVLLKHCPINTIEKMSPSSFLGLKFFSIIFKSENIKPNDLNNKQQKGMIIFYGTDVYALHEIINLNKINKYTENVPLYKPGYIERNPFILVVFPLVFYVGMPILIIESALILSLIKRV